MTESGMVTGISALFGGRVFPDTAPPQAIAPYVIYQQVGGKAFNYAGGGAKDKKPARIQFIVWATTRLEANTLIRQLEDILVSDPFFGIDEGAAVARSDHQTLRGAMQDFSFWIST